jgi:hypothetical protein
LFTNSAGSTTAATDQAAKNGHLEVVKWLHLQDRINSVMQGAPITTIVEAICMAS